MATIIEIQHQTLQAALAQLTTRIEHPAPFYAMVGEDAVERIKQRFASTTGPDGARWKANTMATIVNYIRSKGGFSRKTGKLLAKGQVLAASKRTLQGQSGDLARQIFFDQSESEVTFGSSMIYAAMQQYGGAKARFPHLWGDIPSRQFMPITADGELYPAEADLILGQLQEYLME